MTKLLKNGNLNLLCAGVLLGYCLGLGMLHDWFDFAILCVLGVMNFAIWYYTHEDA